MSIVPIGEIIFSWKWIHATDRDELRHSFACWHEKLGEKDLFRRIEKSEDSVQVFGCLNDNTCNGETMLMNARKYYKLVNSLSLECEKSAIMVEQ